MKEPGRLQSMGLLRVRHDWATSLSCIGEGNGNPLQCSCLENPRDGRAWWAAVYGVAQSWTQLKRLSSSSSSSSSSVIHQASAKSTPCTCPASSLYSAMAQALQNPPAMQATQETRAQSLSPESPLEEKWQPMPGFLPGISCGQRSLVVYSPQGHKELDVTEHTHATCCTVLSIFRTRGMGHGNEQNRQVLVKYFSYWI